MRAKKFLAKIRQLDTIVKNKLFEKEQLEALATSVTQRLTADKVQTSTNPDKMSDVVHKIIKIEEEINEAVDRFVDYRQEAAGIIEQLNPTEYDLLHMVYIQYLSLDEVAIKKNKTYTWVTTVHGRALKNVQNIIDEMAKE